MIAAVALTTLLTACDFTFGGGDGDTGDASPDSAVVAPIETEPPSPFCVAVEQLEQRIAESSTDSDRPIIVEAYTEMLPLVPAEVRSDFEAVLAQLRAGATSTVPTTAPIATADLDEPTLLDTTPDTTVLPGSTVEGTQAFDEGYDPDDTPAARIGSYIGFTCDRDQNNPGPPATQPAEPVPGTTTV
jgi:hypothetical protein